MEYLEAFQYVIESLELMKNSSREQVKKETVSDVMTYMCAIQTGIGQNDLPTIYNVMMERVVSALTAVKTLNCLVLPDSVKQVICDGLVQLKSVVADIAYNYFAIHDFDENDADVVNILLDIIRVKRGVM